MNLDVINFYMFYATRGLFQRKFPSDLQKRKVVVTYHNPNLILLTLGRLQIYCESKSPQRQQELSLIAGGNMIWLQPLWEPVWQLLTKLTMFPPCDPTIVLLSIHLNELKIYAHTKACTRICIAALFIIAKI